MATFTAKGLNEHFYEMRMRWLADRRTWEGALKVEQERADHEIERRIKETILANNQALWFQRLKLQRILQTLLADRLELVIDRNRDRLLQLGVDPEALK